MQLTVARAQMELSQLTPPMTDSYLQEGDGPYHLEDRLSCYQRGRGRALAAPLPSRDSADISSWHVENKQCHYSSAQVVGWVLPTWRHCFKILNRSINRWSSLHKTLISRPDGLKFISFSCLYLDQYFQVMPQSILFRKNVYFSCPSQQLLRRCDVIRLCVCVCVRVCTRVCTYVAVTKNCGVRVIESDSVVSKLTQPPLPRYSFQGRRLPYPALS